MSDARLILRDRILETQGKPYIYGAKGPDWFDCSGDITKPAVEAGALPRVCLRCKLDMILMHGSRRLWTCLEPTKDPLPFDLAFWGWPNIEHVMWLWDDGRVFGACGGDSSTLTLDAAKLRGAKVQFRSGVRYRPGFRGFRRIPLP